MPLRSCMVQNLRAALQSKKRTTRALKSLQDNGGPREPCGLYKSKRAHRVSKLLCSSRQPKAVLEHVEQSIFQGRVYERHLLHWILQNKWPTFILQDLGRPTTEPNWATTPLRSRVLRLSSSKKALTTQALHTPASQMFPEQSWNQPSLSPTQSNQRRQN